MYANRPVLFIALIAVAAASVLIGCQPGTRATRTEQRTVEHLSGSAITIESRNGRVQIVGEPDREDVWIEAELSAGGSSTSVADDRLSRTQLKIGRSTNSTLSVSAIFPTPHHAHDGANITIHVPDATAVEATTSNGHIDARGLDASLLARTSNGRINLSDWVGDASLTSSNGRVKVVNLTGELTVRTSNGRVEVEELGGPADIQTSNGRISLALLPDQTGPIDLRTSNGRIIAEVGSAFAGTVSMQTSNSSLTIDDTASILADRDVSRRRATLTFAEDGPASQLRSSNGSITLRTVE